MFGLEYEDIKMTRMFSETEGDVTTVDLRFLGFIDMRQSRIIVPAGVRVTHISATIDGNEVCSGPLDLQPRSFHHTYEMWMLHRYFDGIPLMHFVPMVVKITASSPVNVEARFMYFTQRVALKLKPYVEHMMNENGGRMMPTPLQLHQLIK